MKGFYPTSQTRRKIPDQGISNLRRLRRFFEGCIGRQFRTQGFCEDLVKCLIYYIILYYTILYYTILYYTILYYTILYYTILYYTILYYIWLVLWLLLRLVAGRHKLQGLEA